MDLILAQVKGLQLQLEVLRARLEAAVGASSRPFSELEGILEGETETTEAELDAAEYRIPWPED